MHDFKTQNFENENVMQWMDRDNDIIDALLELIEYKRNDEGCMLSEIDELCAVNEKLRSKGVQQRKK